MTHSSSPQSSQDAKNLDANESQAEPTLLEQMGGLSGLVSATLPVLVLIPVNNFFGLGPALGAALGVAVAIAIWRVLRKETLQPAISGLLGVALCAACLLYTSDAADE